jgi:hypothetical protein
VQEDDRSLLRSEAHEAALELIAIGHPARIVVHRRLWLDHPNLSREPALAATLVSASVDE